MREARSASQGLLPRAARSAALRALLAAACLLLPAALLQAAGLTYVDADDGVNFFPGNLDPISSVAVTNLVDDLWGYRVFGAVEPGAFFQSIYEASGGGAENVPEITQTITGLGAGTQYDIYIVYWQGGSASHDWNIRAGLSSGNLTLFNARGPSAMLPDAVTGTPAASAIWDAPPVDLNGDPMFFEDPRTMLLGKVGTATASGGQIQVYVDDLSVSEFGANANNFRSWLDGVAYVEAGNEVFLSATVDRGSGNVAIHNATDQAFDIVSYSITSAAGSLNANQWDSISGNFDSASQGGDESIDTDPWNVTAPASPFPDFSTVLSEAEDASGSGGATLAAGGGTWNLGNPWIRTPFSDVQLQLTTTDGSTLVINPEYTGSEVAVGDFNADGRIDLVDAGTFVQNLHTEVALLSLAEAYQLGDVTGDAAINYDDFVRFKSIFDAANGAGALDAFLAGVPEPAAALLCLVIALGAGVCPWGGRRLSRLAVEAWSKRMVGSLAVVALAGGGALAEPVTGPWYTGSNSGTPSLSATDSDSFTWGTLGSAAETARTGVLWSRFDPITLLSDGDKISLGFTVTWNDGADFAGNWALRTGLQNDNGSSLSNNLFEINRDSAFDPWRGYVAMWGLSTNPTGDNSGLFVRNAGDADGDDITNPTTSGGDETDTLINFNDDLGAGVDQVGVPFAYSMQITRFSATEYEVSSTFNDVTMTATTDQIFDTFNSLVIQLTGAVDISSVDFTNVDVSATIGEVSTLELEVNTTSGATQIVNNTDSRIDLDYYEITSDSGSLDPSGWNSLDDGEGGDPVGTGWDEAGGSDATILSEVHWDMASLAPNDALRVGRAFNPAGEQDLSFMFGEPGGILQRGLVRYVMGGLPADFDGNGRVDGADYSLWQAGFGEDASGDSDGDGDSDGGDFLAWQAQFASGLLGGAAAAAVPEPNAGLLALLGFAICASRRRGGLHTAGR